jgi:uncharacterized protein YdhG (YjbR/CyaY superfamily)
MSSFDEYLATVPEPQKAELERIRQAVRREVPEAEEGVSYGMPAFKYKKRPLLAVDAARNELVGFELSKGTVRFTPDKPIPDSALKRLLDHRLREIEEDK